jgi:hypothetical protein
LTFFLESIKSEQVGIPNILERLSSMQLEETASAKDVPPLSYRGVFGLPAFIAQNNMHLQSLVKVTARGANGSAELPLCRCEFMRSLV